ncbi:hypothetical protein SBA4_390005 [Candidatus Sulfopaludibacter sp. SbA4]|nr:hypothetical protein SBA4_390005 [Candidatus Sulfopaludibacter sp. SbA4]
MSRNRVTQIEGHFYNLRLPDSAGAGMLVLWGGGGSAGGEIASWSIESSAGDASMRRLR